MTSNHEKGTQDQSPFPVLDKGESADETI